MEVAIPEHLMDSGIAHVEYDGDGDGNSDSELSSRGRNSRLQRCFQASQRTRDVLSDWRSMFWKRRPVNLMLRANGLVFGIVFCSSILVFETSPPAVRIPRHRTSLFPVYIPHAAGLASACKWEGTISVANFAGFLAGRVYIAGRGGYDIVDVKFVYIIVLSFLGLLEVQLGAHLVRAKLCHDRKSVPLIDTVRDAMWFSGIVFVVSLIFESLIAVVHCATGFLTWSAFPVFWGTCWFAVLAALLSIAPAFIHLLDYRPQYTTLVRPRKIMESLVLTVSTVCVLGLIVFAVPLTTFIRPLPYLLYPLLIFAIFRFNRLGWVIVVALASYFLSWGTLRYKSSALYVISGTAETSSPRLMLQLELFMSVFGIVIVSLAAAIREKKQLTKDLHNMNKKLEDAVRKRMLELTKANEDLQISQSNSEKANHAKSEFLANMSHEIRTPIHGILGLTDDLLSQQELSTDQLESLASVKDCADLLLHIINSILDLAKIEAGRLEVECVPFRIREIITSSLRMLQERAKERGILLLWKVDANVPPVVAGDPGKLQQCLLNLVGNALKFTHHGSVRVSIRLFQTGSEPSIPCSTPPHPNLSGESSNNVSTFSRLRSWASWPSSAVKVEIDDETGTVIELHNTYMDGVYPTSEDISPTAICLSRNSDSQNSDILDMERSILFEVRDTGIGISKEIVDEMFNPFTQADASTSRLYGGTGLGLCIVQRFVELLRGTIWVESEIGRGSTFSFVVPFRLLSGDNSRSTTRRLLQNREGLEALLTSSVLTPGRIYKRSARRDPPQGTSAHSLIALGFSPHLDSEGLEEAVPQIGGLDKCSIDLVDNRKGSLDGHDDSVHSTATATESNDPGRHQKLEEGAANFAASTTFSCRNISEDSNRDQPHIPVVSTCNDSSDLRKDAVIEVPHFFPSELGHLSNIGDVVESSSLRSKDRLYPDDESWDVEKGIAELKIAKSDYRKLIDTSDVEGNSDAVNQPLVRAELNSKLETFKRVHSEEMEVLRRLPRKEKLHILLAEDNLINQKVASRQLMRHGHTVTIVGDGFQALEALRKDHATFDLVLMDIQMPNLDGLEATSKYREEEASQGWSRLPILGLTAHAMSGYQATCLSHGMDAYLGKPFDIKQLLSVIQDLCVRASFT